MKRSTRRTFLKSAAVGTVALGGLPRAAAAEGNSSDSPASVPLPVEGVHGYADAHSVAAGGKIRFHLSVDVPFRLEMVRLGLQVDDPAGDRVVHHAGEFPARPQPIHPGSYVHVASGLRSAPRGLTLECWVRPWSLERLHGLVTQEDKTSDAGFALGLGAGGYVGLFLGDGTGPDEVEVHRTTPGAVVRGRWHHVVGSWDGKRKEIWVDGRKLGEWPFEGPFVPGNHPIRLGAMGENGLALRFLDGDLAQCAVYGRALSELEIRQRAESAGLVPAGGKDVVGNWDFSEERGDRVGDRSGRRRHGRLIHQGTWMIGGPSWDPDVPRFGDYDPRKDPRRGLGRFVRLQMGTRLHVDGALRC